MSVRKNFSCPLFLSWFPSSALPLPKSHLILSLYLNFNSLSPDFASDSPFFPFFAAPSERKQKKKQKTKTEL